MQPKQGKQTFEMLEIEVGTKENGWVEVLNSSNFDGKEIVSKGAYTLLMSLKNKAEEWVNCKLTNCKLQIGRL